MSAKDYPLDFFIEVQKGNIPGHSITTFNCANSAVGTSEEVLSPGGPAAYTYPTAAAQVVVVSNTATDTIDGSGARTVVLSGLDTDYCAITETLNLSGSDNVTSVNSYLRINGIRVATAGGDGKNKGTIKVESTATDVTYLQISAGANLNQDGVFTLANNQDGYLVQALFTAETGKTAEYRVYTRTQGGVFLNVANFNVVQGFALNRIVPFRKIPAKTDIEIRGVSLSTTSQLHGLITLLTVDPDKSSHIP